MKGYIIAIAIVAFIIGTLYRISYILDMGILRMYGSFGILLIGYLGTSMIRSKQVNASRNRTFAALRQWEERGIPLIGIHHILQQRGYPEYILITRKVWAITVNDMPNYGGGLSARGLIKYSIKQTKQAAEQLQNDLDHLGFAKMQVMPILLFLRRDAKRIPKLKQTDEVYITNLEQLNQWIEADIRELSLEEEQSVWHKKARELVHYLSDKTQIKPKSAITERRLSD